MRILSHYDEKGRVQMVDVTEKPVTSRSATARVFVRMQRETLETVRRVRSAKGKPDRNRADRGNFSGETDGGADSTLSSSQFDACRCESEAMQEWN